MSSDRNTAFGISSILGENCPQHVHWVVLVHSQPWFKKNSWKQRQIKKKIVIVILILIFFFPWKWPNIYTPFQDGDQVEVFRFGTDKGMEVISKIFTKDKAPFLEGITASNNLFGWIQGNGGQLTNDLREKTNKKYIFFDFTKNFIINSFLIQI